MKLGLLSGAVLALAGGAGVLLQPGLVQGRLTQAGRAVFMGVGRAMLQGSLPSQAQAQQKALQGLADRVDTVAQNLPPAVQAELSQLVGLLATAPGRAGLAGLTSPWMDAEPAQVAQALQGMRQSRLALRQQAYQALHEIVCGAYFADESTWAQLGYPGPQDI